MATDAVEQTDGNPEKRARGGCGGCLVRSGVGCFSAVAGAAAVVFVLAPSLLSGFVAQSIEAGFADRWMGTLEMGELDLSWTERQVAPNVALRDPDGAVIARGSLVGPPLFRLFESWDEGRSGPAQRWTFRADEARVRVDENGDSSLARALTRTEAGRLEVERAARRGRSWWGERGLGRRALFVEADVDRVLWSDDRVDADAREVARDLSLRLLLDPQRPAEILLDAQLAGEPAGKLGLKLSFTEAPWWEAAGAPFDLDVDARGLDSRIAASLLPGELGLAEWFGDALEVRVSAHRKAASGGRLTALRVAGPASELECSGAFDSPELLRPRAWSAGCPANAGSLAGKWSGFPHELRFLGARAAWPPGSELAFDAAWETPDGAPTPRWTLALRPTGALRVATGPEGPGLELEPVTLALQGGGAEPFSASLDSVGLKARLEGERTARGLVDASLRLERPLAAEAAAPVFGAFLPFARALVAGAEAPATLRLSALTLPAGDAGTPVADGHVDLAGGTFRFVPAISRLFRGEGSGAVRAPAGIPISLAGQRVAYGGAALEVEGDTIGLAGHWDRATRRLDLRLDVPFSLLAEGAVPFLDEYRDLIGLGVTVPLLVRGPLDRPTVEVDAAFRADLLEGAVGSMRDVVDFLEEEVGGKIANQALDLLEQVGGMIRRE